MPFELEALVGHLYVVNGRTISAPPPGALVEVSPRKAARGREADTIFVLVLPSGEAVVPANFYEQMAALTAERYFSSSGSVTAGLRTVFNHINANLFDHNQRDPRHYEASLLCAVLRGTDLYVGRVGAGMALLRHDDAVQQFPADFSSDDALYGPPIGVRAEPDIRMAMYEVAHGTRLLLADAGLASLNFEEVSAALALEDIGAVLVALKNLVRSNITLTLIEFVPPEEPAPLPVRSVESTAAGAPPVELAGSPFAPPTPEPIAPSGRVAPEAEAISRPPREAAPPRLSPARGQGVRRAVGSLALVFSSMLERLNNALDSALPEPKPGQRSFLSSPAAAGLAIFVPVLVVVLVVILWLSGTGESEFDQCVTRANEAANLARGITSSDVQGTLAAWNAVLRVVASCDEIRPDDPQMLALRREGRGVIDALLQIERRVVRPIDALPSATLTRIVLQGEDLYVLDDANDQVYRLTLSSDGLSLVPGTRQPIPAMRRGGIVSQFTVGELIDIAWADDGSGLSQGSVIVALDRNGVLIDCPPRFLQSCRAQRIFTDVWINPVAIKFWQGRLYVLDPGANQIWRYDPAGGAFPNAPIEYFGGEGRPDIRNAVDFGIDTPGSIYIVMSNGDAQRYTGGQRVGFSFANFPDDQPPSSARAMFLNTNPIAQVIYFVNRDERTIFETTHAGTLVNSFRAEEEELFAEVAGVVADSPKQLIYVTSGNSILVFNRSRTLP